MHRMLVVENSHATLLYLNRCIKKQRTSTR